jgi:hypothetical protein
MAQVEGSGAAIMVTPSSSANGGCPRRAIGQKRQGLARRGRGGGEGLAHPASEAGLRDHGERGVPEPPAFLSPSLAAMLTHAAHRLARVPGGDS